MWIIHVDHCGYVFPYVFEANERNDMRSVFPHQREYANGTAKPRYPVPAVRGWNGLTPGNDGGVADDCTVVGSTFVDWSRGKLELY